MLESLARLDASAQMLTSAGRTRANNCATYYILVTCKASMAMEKIARPKLAAHNSLKRRRGCSYEPCLFCELPAEGSCRSSSKDSPGQLQFCIQWCARGAVQSAKLSAAAACLQSSSQQQEGFGIEGLSQRSGRVDKVARRMLSTHHLHHQM